MRIWKLEREVELRPVLTHCLLTDHVDRLLLALRQDEAGDLLHPEYRPATERIFAGRILEWRIARRWQATISTERDCHIAVVEFREELVEPMCSAGPKLLDWTGWPPVVLPEDLCLYREGAEWPSLVSVTHERDAWILASDKPTLVETEEASYPLEQLLIPPASHGFLL